MFTRAEWLRVPTDKACSRHVDHYIIPSVSMPLRRVDFLVGKARAWHTNKTRDTDYSSSLA